MADGAAVTNASAAEEKADRSYPSLRPFRQTDQDHFFGRSTESTALAEFWQDNRIVLVAGPVACGKTSLLHAGVLPILTRDGAHVLPPGRISYGAAFPSAALPEHNPYTLALLRSWSRAKRRPGSSTSPFRNSSRRGSGLTTTCSTPRSTRLMIFGRVRSTTGIPRRFLADLADAVAAEPRLHLLLLARRRRGHLVSASWGPPRDSISPADPARRGHGGGRAGRWPDGPSPTGLLSGSSPICRPAAS